MRRRPRSCRAASRTRGSRSSSPTSSGSAASSGASTPGPAERDPAERSRERKERRGPKREPGVPGEHPRTRCDEPAPEALLRGIEELNAGHFYEQHETLELLWRATESPVRGMYHGILQIGVGLHHWTRGNHHGASVLLAEGIDRLGPFEPECHGVDVAAIVHDATVLREELLRLGPARMRERDLAGALRIRVRAAGER